MKITRLAIPDICQIEPQVFGDARGFFMATWQDEVFRRNVADVTFVQDNQSRSRRGTIRGLHFQAAHTQGKLLRCPFGQIWDVVVDVRRSSPTCGKWVSTELSESNHRQLWVPPGFAHGFLVLSEFADLQYKVTDRYDQESEVTLQWDDPALGIPWPLPDGVPALLAEKDQRGIPFATLPLLP